MVGLDQTMRRTAHRKEIIVGNLQGFLADRWKQSSDVAGTVEKSFWSSFLEAHRGRNNLLRLLLSPATELSELLLLMQALRAPATLPSSFASLSIIRSSIQEVYWKFRRLKDQANDIEGVFSDFRQLYELPNIPKGVLDGGLPFPENAQDLREGVSIEFRNVTFQYPNSESKRYVLKNASFKIEKGQLCVIVGTNGSGKSTLLKLILRLYDPTEGFILVNDIDIRNLKVQDLRACISTLFQDFTIFPFSIQKNIAIGSPSHAEDSELIERAAELGGCTDIINRLPDKYDTYMDHPVPNYFSRLPAGTSSLFGSKGLHTFASDYGAAYRDSTNELSGGEEQRLALARSFMRTVAEESKIGLLLFDEPSAALDPEAEFTLFERLRKLRGSKSMVFSTHRFGNLTRHADLILYVKDSEILEQGKHEDLIKLDGGYASMYKIQAAAFQE